MSANDVGYFVFSLDTELALGHFDHFDPARFSADGQRERRTIETLLDIFAEYDIIATWAVVGHMFFAACEDCAVCPILEWEGKYDSFKEVYHTDKPLWYGADVIETLRTRGPQHEIAFHGYTHEVFDESTMSRERARIEIQEWKRLAARVGISPASIVFPRDRVGFLDMFKAEGFTNYRDDEHFPLLLRPKRIGPLIKTIDHILGITAPPVHALGVEPNGMVNLRPSQHIFAFNRKLETFLDARNLHTLRLRRIVRGIKKAAAERKFIHVWAHPWEFRTAQDFDKLRYILAPAAAEIQRGRMRSVSMSALAQIALEAERA